MLAMPANSVQDEYDSQPLVVVQDTAEDMAFFLSSTFNH